LPVSWLNWPNRITISRIVLVVPLIICMLNVNTGWHGWRYLAIGVFGVMALSDALDGFLARRLRSETPLGRFLDPLADKLLIVSTVILLATDATAVPGFKLPSWVPVITIGKDVFTVIGFGLVYATTGEFFVHTRAWGKVCTVLQLVMIGFCLVAPDLPSVIQRPWPVLYWAAAGLAVIATVDYLRIGNRFAAEQHARSRNKVDRE